MPFRRCVSFAAFSLTLVTLTGCHNPYGPNRYYPPGYPANMQYGQPQYLPQQGGYPVPGSVTVPGDNTIYSPAPGSPFPSDAPTIDNNTPGFGADGYRSSDYGDDNQVPRPKDTTTFDSDREPFGELGTSPADNVASAEFRAPRRVDASPQMDSADDYSWLRGIVKLDPVDGSCDITYSLNGTDSYGGTMSLAPHASLANIRNGDIVQVNGQIGGRNAHGAPQYRISSLRKLTPTE